MNPRNKRQRTTALEEEMGYVRSTGRVPRSMKPSKRQRSVYIILALFLGGVGAHNIYLGRTGSGIVKICVTALLLAGNWYMGAATAFPAWLAYGLWIVIEAVAVTKDDEGRELS